MTGALVQRVDGQGDELPVALGGVGVRAGCDGGEPDDEVVGERHEHRVPRGRRRRDRGPPRLLERRRGERGQRAGVEQVRVRRAPGTGMDGGHRRHVPGARRAHELVTAVTTGPILARVPG